MNTIGVKLDTKAEADVLIVGVTGTKAEPRLTGVSAELAQEWEQTHGSPLWQSLESLGASITLGAIVTTSRNAGKVLLAVGLDENLQSALETATDNAVSLDDTAPLDNTDLLQTAENVRRATGAALRWVANLPGKSSRNVAISYAQPDPVTIRATVEGALLGAYRYRADKDNGGISEITIIVPEATAEIITAIKQGEITATAVNKARDLINTPANLLYPETFAQEITALAKSENLDVEIWDETALATAGFGGILAVGDGSVRKPRLAKVTYTPEMSNFHLTLVGKGITFDSGGLDIKPPDSMYTMKHDMSGAASVVAAISAIAALQLAVKVTAWMPLAENMPSGSAYRSSDVLTSYSGVTIENSSTDAEGRIVLADALAKAIEETPDLIVDVATLTGACRVALGDRTAGLFVRDDDTADLILDAAQAAGESLWQLPMLEEAPGKLRSLVADTRSNGDRYGSASTAAAFLAKFVPETIKWAHLDIAGPAWNPHSSYYYVSEGATGMSVRTLIALAEAKQIENGI